jgi:hypothetical protein
MAQPLGRSTTQWFVRGMNGALKFDYLKKGLLILDFKKEKIIGSNSSNPASI